jgi:hypothetical protein
MTTGPAGAGQQTRRCRAPRRAAEAVITAHGEFTYDPGVAEMAALAECGAGEIAAPARHGGAGETAAPARHGGAGETAAPARHGAGETTP